MTSSAAPSSTDAWRRRAGAPLAVALGYGAALASLGILPPLVRVPLGAGLLLVVPGVLLLRALRLPPEPAARFFALVPVGGAGVTILACLALEGIGALAGQPRRLDALPVLAAVGVASLLLSLRRHPDFRIPLPRAEPWPALLAILSAALLLAAVESMDAGGARWPVLLGIGLVGLSVLLPLARQDAPAGTSLLALCAAAVALLVARGATSDFLVGGDVFSEFEGFLTTLEGGSAFVPGQTSILTSSLGVSHLPAAVSLVLGLSPLATFKVAMPALLAATFLLAYALGVVLLGPRWGYVAALFALLQLPSLHLLTGQVRVGVATVFSAALFLAMFSPDLGRASRLAWVVLLCALLALSYYMAPLLVLGLLALVLLSRVLVRRPDRSVLTPVVALTLGAMVVVWWDTLGTAQGLKAYVLSLKAALSQIRLLLAGLAAREAGQAAAGHWMDRVLAVANYASFVVIAVGAFVLVRRNRRFAAAGTDLGLLALAATAIAGAWLVVPGLGHLYGGDRLFLQVVPLLGVAFAAGLSALPDRVSRPAVAGVALAAVFLLNTHLAYAAVGAPKSEIFDPASEARLFIEVHPEEVAAASWLQAHRDTRATVLTTSMTQPGRNFFVFTEDPLDPTLTVYSLRTGTGVHGGYVLVRHVTLAGGLVYTLEPDGAATRLRSEPFEPRWEPGARVYDAGAARIHFVSGPQA